MSEKIYKLSDLKSIGTDLPTAGPFGVRGFIKMVEARFENGERIGIGEASTDILRVVQDIKLYMKST